MKKAIAIVSTIVIATILSSCAKSYTCNTYVKANDVELKKERI